jgi:hypothetical protein
MDEGDDEVRMLETPPRKRPRSSTPRSSAKRHSHINKRFCPNPRASPSPRTVHFDRPATDDDAIPDSDVPESPIPLKRTNLEVSFAAPETPMREIKSPFERLNLRASGQKKGGLATPVTGGGGESVRSVKKSAKKTPGSARANKPQPFRIKVRLKSAFEGLTWVVFGDVDD